MDGRFSLSNLTTSSHSSTVLQFFHKTLTHKKEILLLAFVPHSLVVRIPGFHPGSLGLMPSVGILWLPNICPNMVTTDSNGGHVMQLWNNKDNYIISRSLRHSSRRLLEHVEGEQSPSTSNSIWPEVSKSIFWFEAIFKIFVRKIIKTTFSEVKNFSDGRFKLI